MRSKKQRKGLIAKPSSRAPAGSLAKRPNRRSRSAEGADLRRPDETVERRFAASEQIRFKRFQKGARKVGLLVSWDAYDLYFRDQFGD
jgi:hypothetical protein